MAWWGKIVGGAFGLVLGGPLGAVLGAVLGHRFDQGMASLPDASVGWDPGDQERVQTAFFTATFAIMGHVAKADGRVSTDEIRMAEAVMEEMDLNAAQRRAAIGLFDQGKDATFSLDSMLEQFRRECHGRSTLMRLFLEIQLQAAYADGRCDASEDRVLRHICGQLGFSEFDYLRLRRMIEAQMGLHSERQGQRRQQRGAHRAPKQRAPSIADAYAVLGIEAGATDAEVKKAYRRLRSQHHPDKLVAKGLPEEMMKLAAHKTIEIRQAYEQIKQARGL